MVRDCPRWSEMVRDRILQYLAASNLEYGGLVLDPAAYSCRCATACSRSMKSLGIDVRMSATKLDAKVVGTRPASRT